MVFGPSFLTPNGGLPLFHGDSTTNVNPATQVYSETESFGFGATNITCHYQSITSVPFYRTWSFEELRLQNYVLKTMADGFRHTVAALKGGPMLHPPPTVTKPPPVGATAVPTFGNTYSKGYSCTGFSFGTSIPVGFNEQRFRPGVRWSFGPIGSNDRQHDGAFGTQQARGFSDGNVYGSGARSESRGGWFGSSTTVSMGFNRIAYHGPFGASAFTSRPLGLNFKASPWPPGAPRSGESSTISFFPSAGAAGTSHPPYQQTVVGSQDIPVDMLLHSITGMDAYRGFSVEELRLQDYRRKHPC